MLPEPTDTLSVSPWLSTRLYQPRPYDHVVVAVEMTEIDGTKKYEWMDAFWNGQFWVKDNAMTRPNERITYPVVAYMRIPIHFVKEMMQQRKANQQNQQTLF